MVVGPTHHAKTADSFQVADCVPAEQLQDLQKQAEEVGQRCQDTASSLLHAPLLALGEQLRKDNKELRESLDMLKSRLDVLRWSWSCGVQRE